MAAVVLVAMSRDDPERVEGEQSETERQLEAARAQMPHLPELIESERLILNALAENEEEPDYGPA